MQVAQKFENEFTQEQIESLISIAEKYKNGMLKTYTFEELCTKAEKLDGKRIKHNL